MFTGIMIILLCFLKGIISYWSISETTTCKLPSFLRANAGLGIQQPGPPATWAVGLWTNSFPSQDPNFLTCNLKQLGWMVSMTTSSTFHEPKGDRTPGCPIAYTLPWMLGWPESP